jgi:hypothetical protein
VYIFEENETFDSYQAVIINTPLLKSSGFKYEGCLFDGQNGQRAYLEDEDLLFYCHKNNIKTIKINSLSLNFDLEHESVVWENKKKGETMKILSYLWMLNKYREYKSVSSYLYEVIKCLVGDVCYHDVEEIVNEISYEILNKDEGEIEMKRMLIGGLVVFLMAGLVVGCPTDDKKEESGGKVAKEYQGTYLHLYGAGVVLTESKFEWRRGLNEPSGGVVEHSFPARTDETDLYCVFGTNYPFVTGDKPEEIKIGYFEDNKLILDNYKIRPDTSGGNKEELTKKE